jgi:hypothetical protein
MSSPDLTEAIVLWSGRGESSWPRRETDVLTAWYGQDVGRELAQKVLQLANEFYGSDARLVEGDLVAMGELAAAQFRARHPEIGEAGVEALAWCYMYDHK